MNCGLVASLSQVVLGNRRMVTEVREGAVDVTPDYDSHLFAVGPNISQTLSEQAIRNQVSQLQLFVCTANFVWCLP